MAFGITSDGFVIKRLQDIEDEVDSQLRAALGNAINLLPTQALGQIKKVFCNQLALGWEELQAQYDALSAPENSTGVPLDNIVAYTGIERLPATKGTGTVTAYGVLGTVIHAGKIISVNGNSDYRFVTTEDATIAAGTNEVQTISFSSTPDAGEFTLIYDGDETAAILFSDAAADVATALNAIGDFSGITVTGTFAADFVVTFATADGSFNWDLLSVGDNTLTTAAVAVDIDIAETTAGVRPNIDIAVEAEDAGNIPAYANTLTVIETPLAGWDSVNNAADIDAGEDIETDAALLARRAETLATAGAGTADAIRAQLLGVADVTAAMVFENDSDVTVGDRTPHSIEAVVVGGANQDIWDTIRETKGAGIETIGSVTGTSTNSQGIAKTINFSRPTEKDIYITVDNYQTDSDFPVDGETQIKQALADYGDENYSIGDDVIWNNLHCALESIAGLIDYDLFIGFTASPTGDTNLTIDDDEIAIFDTANIVTNAAP